MVDIQFTEEERSAVSKKPSWRLEELRRMSLHKACLVVGTVLSREGEGTTEEYKAVKTLMLMFPFVAQKS